MKSPIIGAKVRFQPIVHCQDQNRPYLLAFICQNLPTYTYLPFYPFEYQFHRKTTKNKKFIMFTSFPTLDIEYGCTS